MGNKYNTKFDEADVMNNKQNLSLGADGQTGQSDKKLIFVKSKVLNKSIGNVDTESLRNILHRDNNPDNVGNNGAEGIYMERIRLSEDILEEIQINIERDDGEGGGDILDKETSNIRPNTIIYNNSDKFFQKSKIIKNIPQNNNRNLTNMNRFINHGNMRNLSNNHIPRKPKSVNPKISPHTIADISFSDNDITFHDNIDSDLMAIDTAANLVPKDKSIKDIKQRGLPSLDPINKISRPKFVGPTDECNWVIPDVMMAGGFPGDIDDELNRANLISILQLGIGVFVSLQEEFPIEPRSIRRNINLGYDVRPYHLDIMKLYKRDDIWIHCQRPEVIDFLHFPIKDLTANAKDRDIINLCQLLIQRMDNQEKIYIHCWGGHGRTGIIASVILGMVYDMPPNLAMKYIQVTHDCRVQPLDAKSPQTKKQRDQVRRILKTRTVDNYKEFRRSIGLTKSIYDNVNKAPNNQDLPDKKEISQNHLSSGTNLLNSDANNCSLGDIYIETNNDKSINMDIDLSTLIVVDEKKSIMPPNHHLTENVDTLKNQHNNNNIYNQPSNNITPSACLNIGRSRINKNIHDDNSRNQRNQGTIKPSKSYGAIRFTTHKHKKRLSSQINYKIPTIDNCNNLKCIKLSSPTDPAFRRPKVSLSPRENSKRTSNKSPQNKTVDLHNLFREKLSFSHNTKTSKFRDSNNSDK